MFLIPLLCWNTQCLLLFSLIKFCCTHSHTLVIYHLLWNKTLPLKHWGFFAYCILSDKVPLQSCSSSICLHCCFHLEWTQFISTADLPVKPTFGWMQLARERIVFHFLCSKSKIWFAVWNSSPSWKWFYLWCTRIIYSWKHKGPSSVPECMRAGSTLCIACNWGQDLAPELWEWGSEQCWENWGLLKSSCSNSVAVFQL